MSVVQEIRVSSIDPSVVEALTTGVLTALRLSYQADCQAAGQVRSVARVLEEAAAALKEAAEGLRAAGKGLQANAAIAAYTRTLQAAEGLLHER